MKKGCVVLPKASSHERLAENFKANLIYGELLDAETEKQLDSLIDLLGQKKYCWDSSQVL
jgi:diketogulonate reductase-like aldo/keto reductase